jgi:hypothetical protein
MATNPKGYPYPVGTDRVMDGDDAIKALADAVAAKLGQQVATGQASVGLNAAASANVAVTFPAGIFTVVPRVVCVLAQNTSQVYATSGAVTTSGFTASLIARAGTAITIGPYGIDWVAVQF